MKMRIKGNTLRFRLSKKEVITLAEKGSLEEQTEFINGTFIYSIQQTNDAAMHAALANNNITLYIPKSLLQQWAHSDQVGVNAEMNLQNGNTLYLLLEKDFKCIDIDVNEDQSDYFENPHFTC